MKLLRWLAAGWLIRRLFADRPVRAMWWDVSPGWTLDNLSRLRLELAALRINRLYVEIQAEDDPELRPYWSAAELEELDRGLPGVEVWAMVWPRPNRNYVDRLDRLMSDPGYAAAVDGWQYDLEGRWAPVNLGGFADVEAAGVAIADLADRAGKPWGVTTHSGRAAYLTGVLKRAREVAIQAYSTHNGGDPDYAYGGRFGPGDLQRHAVAAALSAGARRVVVGLAAYDQSDYPGGPDRAMTTAYDAAREASPAGVAWWSGKWVLGPSKNSYPARVIALLGAAPAQS